MRTAIAAALCCCAVVPLAGTLPSTAAPKRLPVPASVGKGLGQYAQPAGPVEGFAAYVPQTSCDPRWRKGVAQFRDLVLVPGAAAVAGNATPMVVATAATISVSPEMNRKSLERKVILFVTIR